MTKDEALKFIENNQEYRPINASGNRDNDVHFITIESAIYLVNKIFKEASQQDDSANVTHECEVFSCDMCEKHKDKSCPHITSMI